MGYVLEQWEQFFAAPGSGFPKGPVKLGTINTFDTKEQAEKVKSQFEKEWEERNSWVVKIDSNGQKNFYHKEYSTNPRSYHFWYSIRRIG